MALSTSSSTGRPARVAVIGGGASGVFASIAAAEYENTQVTVLEATSQTLKKVKISGGGRCNVMHDPSKSISTILSQYPRGRRELKGVFHKHFTPTMAHDWFQSHGVKLKTEADGRVFPVTDSSQTIVDALTSAAFENGVAIQKRSKVASIVRQDGSVGSELVVGFKDGRDQVFDAVILATGSTPGGFALAKSLGHSLVRPVPSLFTLNCKPAVSTGGMLHNLSGISVPAARVSLDKKTFQEGPLLITHHGLSGPAALRLSAFAARRFNEQNYKGQITISWDTRTARNPDAMFEVLWKLTTSHPKRTVAGACPLSNAKIPKRLWSAIATQSGFDVKATWGNASKALVRKLAVNLVACPMEVTGKGTFKEEFVTAGGVDLKEVDMKTMGSRICPGLYFCGEMVNVDGVTGGFNFMNCWGTGHVAGNGAATYTNEMQGHDAGP